MVLSGEGEEEQAQSLEIERKVTRWAANVMLQVPMPGRWSHPPNESA